MAEHVEPTDKTWPQASSDGWVRTPLPPSRDGSTPGTWFERTGAPPQNTASPTPPPREGLQFARIVLWTGIVLALFFASLVLVV